MAETEVVRPGDAPISGVRWVVKKLFTKEDRHYLHKTLGLACVISFVYRYFAVLPKLGNLGFDGNWFDWATMFLHLGLSCSSLIFHVLAKRIMNRPMIIWEEYRLHAIIFTLRCFVVYCNGRVFEWYVPDPQQSNLAAFALFAQVMVLHLIVDEITRRHGTVGNSAVRMDGNSNIPRTVVFRLYSFYQFLALGSHLCYHPRLSDLGWNTLVAIQSSAFLMTLYRKGVIKYYTHAIWYSACLIVSTYYILGAQTSPLFLIKVALVYACRLFRPNVPKYVWWTAFALVSSPFVHGMVTEALSAHPATSRMVHGSVLRGFSKVYDYMGLGGVSSILLFTAAGMRTWDLRTNQEPSPPAKPTAATEDKAKAN